MKANIHKLFKIMKKNGLLSFLSISILISILIIQIYIRTIDAKQEKFINFIENVFLENTINHIANNLNPRYTNIEHTVSYGETFKSILKKYNIPSSEIAKIEANISKKTNINNLKKDQKLKFSIDQSNNKKIISLVFPISKTIKINVSKKSGIDEFYSEKIVTNLTKKLVLKEGIIKNSLYKSATKAKIKPNIIVEFARIYGFEVDFQRDIRKNDAFQIIYEVFEDDNEKIHETGNIIFGNLILRGQKNPYYYFGKKKSYSYYDKNGKSVQKALMKTPINGARLSSSFGMRKHPILGFNRMHRGTDFAAPEGTPIMASGNGTVVAAKWCGGGGNCVKIKHNSTYSTVYAHMSKFAKGIKPGRKVKQGQIIGYVGSTGMSTGPHLHYEVIENGKRINSQKLKLPSGKILKGNDRKNFEIARIKIDVLMSDLVAKQN